jgi:hypothetical protein
VIVGNLADPARGGNPATALGWLSLCVPCTLLVSALVPRRRQPSGSTQRSARV